MARGPTRRLIWVADGVKAVASNEKRRNSEREAHILLSCLLEKCEPMMMVGQPPSKSPGCFGSSGEKGKAFVVRMPEAMRTKEVTCEGQANLVNKQSEIMSFKSYGTTTSGLARTKGMSRSQTIIL